jgi:hypothetical protein
MISFQTDNLVYNLYRSDGIDVDVFLTPEVLDYVFTNYLFFIEEDILSEG